MSQGDRIKEARKSAKLTQEQLGEACGVSRAAVSLWENGDTKELKSTNLAAAAKATGYNYDYLLSGKGPKTRSGTNILGAQEPITPAIGEESSKYELIDEFHTIGGHADSQNKNITTCAEVDIHDEYEATLLKYFRLLSDMGKLHVLGFTLNEFREDFNREIETHNNSMGSLKMKMRRNDDKDSRLKEPPAKKTA